MCYTPVTQSRHFPVREFDLDNGSEHGKYLTILISIGFKPTDLFGAKALKSNNCCESPFTSESSSVGSNYSNFNTPIQPEKTFRWGGFDKNNGRSRCPEVNDYINNVIKEGDDGYKHFINYQYDHNLFSPFSVYNESPAREPLGDIQPFSVQRKLVYTHCVKDNRKDFSFPYSDQLETESDKGFSLFGNIDNDKVRYIHSTFVQQYLI